MMQYRASLCPSREGKPLTLLSIYHILSILKSSSHAKPIANTTDECCYNSILKPPSSPTINDEFSNQHDIPSRALFSLSGLWKQPRKTCAFQCGYFSNQMGTSQNSKRSTASFSLNSYGNAVNERVETKTTKPEGKERDLGAVKGAGEDQTMEENIHQRLDTLIDTKTRKLVSKRAAKKGNFRSSSDEVLTDLEKVYTVIMKLYNNINMLEMTLDKCGVTVTPELVVQVLNRCGAAGNPAFRFFIWAGKKPGYIHTNETYNIMINIMGRMTQFETVWAMLEEMRKTDPSMITPETFIIMMRRFAAARMVQKAIDVLDEMPKFGCEPDAHTFCALLDALCKHGKVQEAIALFGDMKIRFPPNLKNYTVLLNGLCTTGRLKEAHSMLDEMVELGFEPDLVVYNTLLNGYAKAGKIGEAFDLLNEMKNRGCPPNTASYTNLIHALCAAERLEEASRLFKDMKRNGCFPDVVSYTTLINGFCNLRKLDQGYQLLDDMVQQRCVPNQLTYSCLLREHERREELKEALDLFQEMSENGCDPDLSIYNILLRLSCKLGKLNEASTIWNKMINDGISPNLETYTIFIHGLHNQDNLADACKYFKEMVGKGVLPAPQYGTLKALLNTLLRAGKFEVAADIWDSMKKHGSHINIFAYTIWIQALCSNGQVKEACSYCADMIEDGLLPQPSTYQMIMKGLRKLYNRCIADDLRARIRKLISEKNLSFKSFATQGVRKSTVKRKSRKRGGRTRSNEKQK